MIKIKKVEKNSDIKKFIDFPHYLYKNDKNYVPELYITQKRFFNKMKNPFFQHSEAELFLAYHNNQIVGRIAAIQNNNYNKYWNQHAGFFGFFDSTNDFDVAKNLFDTVVNWCKQRNLNPLFGPENFSTNDTCGLLIQGFDSPPVIGMTYNKQYYLDLIEKYGFKKKIDLLAYKLEKNKIPEKLLIIADKIEKRLSKYGIVIRSINMKNFKQEINNVKKIYNQAWGKNWGFVPFTDKEFAFVAKDMKAVVNPELSFVAEHNNQAIAVSVTIPDMNKVLIKLKKGRLLPFGIFTFLKERKKIDRLRVIIMGVLEKYRKKGIDLCFYARTVKGALKHNYIEAEASWVLENNELMNRALQSINAKVYKKYRIFEYEVK